MVHKEFWENHYLGSYGIPEFTIFNGKLYQSMGSDHMFCATHRKENIYIQNRPN